MGRLLLLFVLVPVVEMMLLIEIGRRIGTLPTFALIVMTGFVGAALARWQGLAVLRQIRTETRSGQIPAGPLIDGLMILIAGAVLMTPGVLTDVLGFLCLVPGVRTLLKRELRRRFERAVARGNVTFATDLRGPMVDVTPRARSDDAGILEEATPATEETD